MKTAIVLATLAAVSPAFADENPPKASAPAEAASPSSTAKASASPAPPVTFSLQETAAVYKLARLDQRQAEIEAERQSLLANDPAARSAISKMAAQQK